MSGRLPDDAGVDRYAVTVDASRDIDRPADQVFDVLRDLRRHWALLGSDLIHARLVEGSDADRAELLVGGPVPGIRRRIVTRVTHSDPPTYFAGEAVADSTVALIDWAIDANGGAGCIVTLRAQIEPGGVRDRLLLAAARPWLASRCAQVLGRLERELMDARRID